MEKVYSIDITKVPDVKSRRDFMYILYNEFVLNSFNGDDSKELLVNVYTDKEKERLKSALQKYGAEDEYISEVINESKIENKNKRNMINEGKEGTFKDSTLTILRDIVISVANDGAWDLDEFDPEDFIDEVITNDDMEELAGEIDEENILEAILEIKDELLDKDDEEITEDGHKVLKEVVKYAEDGAEGDGDDDKDKDSKDAEGLDEGFNYARVSDLIKEAEERGRQQALNEAADDLTPGEKMDAWHDGKRKENIKACDAEKLRQYKAICKAKGYDAEVAAIDAEIESRGLKESVDDKAKQAQAKEREQIKIKRSDLKDAKAAWADTVKKLKALVKIKDFASLCKYGEDFDAEKLLSAIKEYFKNEGKEKKEDKAEAIKLARELKKLNKTIVILTLAVGGGKPAAANESVTARFAKNRAMFEGEDDDKNKDNDGEGDGNGDGNGDNGEGKEGGSEGDGKDGDGKKDGDDANTEEEELDIPALDLSVKKEVAEDIKKEMIDAGVEEDDINIVDDDDDEETVHIIVDTNSIYAFRDWYDKKTGKSLEDELNVEIGEEPEEGEEDKDKDKGKDGEGDGDKKDGEKEGDGLDDFDINSDFFADLGNEGE